MKKFLSFSVGLILIANYLSAQVAGDYRTNVITGNWSTLATWQRYDGNNWVTPIVAEGYPGQNTGTGAVGIRSDGTITLDVSPANPIGSLLIGTGNGNNSVSISNQTLNVSGGVVIGGSVSGPAGTVKSLVMNANSILTCTALVLTPGNAAGKTAVLQFNGGTVTVSGNVVMPEDNTAQQLTFINFTGSGTLSFVTMTGGTINGGPAAATITGNLTAGTTINVNATGTTTITGNLTAATINPLGAGTLSITGNAASDTATAGAGPCTINIGGNISAPVATGFTGMVNINGGGTQTTSGAITLANLGMTNAASTLQLGGALTVTGTLTLTNGKINTGTNSLTLTNATATSQLSGGSSTSYVYSNGAGRLIRNNLIAVPYLFPIGTSANYMPVSVTPSGANNFSMNVFSGATTDGVEGGPAIANKSRIVDAVWNITSLNATNSAITIQWVDALEGGTFATFGNSQIGVSHNVAGSWTAAIATGANAASNQVTATFNTFSPFGVGEIGTALPVKFGAIKAYEKQNGIQLDWKVYSENKVKSYEIERSADGRSYTSVGSLPALYNNTSDGDYGFFDANPLPGTSYYRIKNNDLDGKSAYSIVIRVNRNKTIKGLSLYPNPIVNGIVLLQGSDLGRGNYKINIFGANGQEIYKQQLIHNGGTISHSILLPATTSKGVYMLSVKDENGNIIFKDKLVNQ